MEGGQEQDIDGVGIRVGCAVEDAVPTAVDKTISQSSVIPFPHNIWAGRIVLVNSREGGERVKRKKSYIS